MRREPCAGCGRAAPHSTLNRLKLCSHCAAAYKHPHAIPGGSGPGGGAPVRDKTQENAGDGSGGSDRVGSGGITVPGLGADTTTQPRLLPELESVVFIAANMAVLII